MSAADRAIRVSTAAAVLGVAGIAAYVSYWHAFEVVRAHGETGITAGGHTRQPSRKTTKIPQRQPPARNALAPGR